MIGPVKPSRSTAFGVAFMPSSAAGGIRRLSILLALVLAAGSVARLGPAADDRGKPGDAEPTPSASVRTPWTTSRVVGSPEPPPPYKVVQAFLHLKFEHPLLIVRHPGSNRFIVGEQSGVLYSFADTPDARADLFLDLRRELTKVHLLAG